MFGNCYKKNRQWLSLDLGLNLSYGGSWKNEHLGLWVFPTQEGVSKTGNLTICFLMQKILWISGFKTAIYSLTVLEVKNPKSRCCLNQFPSKDSRGEIFFANPSFWWLLVLIGLWQHNWNLCFYVQIAFFSVSLCVLICDL